MRTMIRRTRSVCPVCLEDVPAQLVRYDNEADPECGGVPGIYMEKACPRHDSFRTLVWHDLVDFDEWRGYVPELPDGAGARCASCGGICREHEQGTCCVLLEVTRRCNLQCAFCFADGAMPEPSLEELKRAVDRITERNRPLIQLSGGEPSLRDDLPELVAYIRNCGCRRVQLNSNGLRLAEDEAYVKELARAGLSFVFMQFDGVTDEICRKLRGRDLLEIKERAIDVCGRHGLGVILVPTIVRGINDHQIGKIIRFGAERTPVVRGVHFQPVSFFGRYEDAVNTNAMRYTLDELIDALGKQAGISARNIAPSHCDHPGCGFHSSFMVFENGEYMPLTLRSQGTQQKVSAEKNREYIGSRWERDTGAEQESSGATCCEGGSREMNLDEFLLRAKVNSFTITCMAFQDAMNLDVERLRRCSLHVYEDGVLKPFCARYLTPVRDKERS